MLKPSPDISAWLVARSFLAIFLSVSVLLLAIAGVHYYTQYQSIRVNREASEAVNVTLARRALLADIASVVTDLLVLARQIEGVLSEQDVTDRASRIARTYSIFVEQKRLYDQIRFIDPSGREVVRVNEGEGRAERIGEDALQDKSDRYYVQEALALGPGTFYISPLDLNVEQGSIEYPYKPMMRFATPLFDDAGRKQGILVLNYLGQRLLDNFREAAALVAEHIHLVDDQGYWLSAPHAADAWGLMLGHGRRFSDRFPQAWARMLASSEGQFVTPAGLFTFSSVSPLPVAEAAAHSGFDLVNAPTKPGAGGYLWKIVAHLPPERLGGAPGRFLAQHAFLYLGFLALLALGSALLARSRVSHRLAEAQSEYERRFRRTLEAIDLAAVTVDRVGRLVYCNPYFLHLTGWRSEEVLGASWLERFVPAAQRDKIAEVLGGLVAPELFPERFEMQVQTRDGGTRLIAWHNSLSLDAKGEALSVTGIGEDVTEARRAGLELIKLHRAVEQSPSIVLITDRHGRIEYVNPKFCEVTGYLPQEVVGRNPRLLKSGDTDPQEYSDLWGTISQGGVWYGELHNRRKNGDLYWEAAAISAVRDGSGEITHYLAVKEDITERKRLEQEVEQRNRELAKAQTLAEMGRMASMIADDLRNPLSSVKMTLQVLSRSQASQAAETEELKRIALEQVAYMEAILQDMLTYARPQTLRLEWLHGDKLIETAVGLARRKIDEHRVLVKTSLQPGLPTFPGDSNQLGQVLSNLLLNAVQAMEQVPPEQRELELSASLELTPEGTVIRFEICDRGIGLAEAEAERLFEPFYTTRAKGTGLGLAIVRRIIETHSGRVELKPRPDGGTCAAVTLPTVPAAGDGPCEPQDAVAL